MLKSAPTVVFSLAFLVLLGSALPVRADAEEKVEVNVVAIIASKGHMLVDADLKNIAKAVQKFDPKLTGFRKSKVSKQVLTVGGKAKFPVGGEKTVQVTIQQGMDKENRISLTVKPPESGEIVYASTCGKYFPIVTRYRPRDGERLILAVMVKPPNVEKKEEKK